MPEMTELVGRKEVGDSGKNGKNGGPLSKLR